jgi:tripartite-type tricarboxylate transporter receptor subunit TctC
MVEALPRDHRQARQVSGVGRQRVLRRALRSLAIAAICMQIFAAPAFAQADEPAKGKTVTIYVGNSAGGGYDAYARLLARHLGRHLPGEPAVVVSDMPGGQGITCANFLYNLAPRDGTAIGLLQQNVAEAQVFGAEGVRFDAGKFNWIGRMTTNVEIHYVWHDVPVNSIEDLKRRETIFAAVGPGTIIYPTMLNAMIGTRFKLVRGYPGTQAAHLAMERGEVEGASSSLTTLRTIAPDWLESHKVKIILQHTLTRSPELPDVPAVVELGPTREDKDVLAFFASGSLVGRSFVAPPEMRPDRLRLLREGFEATMRDPQFLADAGRMKIAIDALPGEALRLIIDRSLALPEPERERARQYQ